MKIIKLNFDFPQIVAALSFMITFFFVSSNAQEKDRSYYDSLYNRLMIEIGLSDNENVARVSSENEIIKCQFGLRSEIKTNLSQFTPAQQAKLQSVLARPQLQKSIVSQSGFFRIHFDTTGSSAPAYVPNLSAEQNAMLVAEAFDSSYSFEVDYLGYPAPPDDEGNGGDILYDVYVVNLGNGTYGYTEPDFAKPTGSQKHTSYIVIDNDYVGSFNTHGTEAMKVTAAHEFHHSIQMGNYIYRSEDLFFYELTSTSMEEFVFNDVNDYHAYVYSYFNNTNRVFSKNPNNNLYGYDLALWNIFIADTLNIDIIKRQWQLMPNMRAMDAINTSLVENGSSFSEKLNEFGIWCYYTNYRAKPDQYFEDAAELPVTVRSLSSMEFTSNSKSVSASSTPASNLYITFYKKLSGFPDTLTVMISNFDFKSAVSNQNSSFAFDYTLYDHPEPGASKLSPDYYFKFNSENSTSWSTAEILNDELIKGAVFTEGEIDYVFPSPFYYTKNSYILIPAKFDAFRGTDLNIYTSSMDLVYSSSVTVQKIFGQTVVRWNALDNSGNKLATGVYLYAVKTGDETSTGKIVIFNE